MTVKCDQESILWNGKKNAEFRNPVSIDMHKNQ